MGAAGPRWAVVDELVHELGSLRAVVQEVEAEPDLAEHDVALELRTSLARAADTIHLVIGGAEGLVSQARRCIAEAQEVGRRARLVLERSRATHRQSRSLRDDTRALHEHGRAVLEEARAQVRRGERRVDALKQIRESRPAAPGAARGRDAKS